MGNISLPSIEEIKEVFFKSGISGWAGDIEPVEISGLPGSHLIGWSCGPWQVSDIYWTTTGFLHSCGTTVICHDGQPVWQMQYHGWYKEEAIPLLKEALLAAYQSGEFIGGRGLLLRKNKMLYRNSPTPNGSFQKFDGMECIARYGWNISRELLGEHVYRGGLLIETC